MITVSKQGISLIKRHEGLVLEAYLCPAKVLTIGYGHTGSDVFEGQKITELEAEQLLINDLVRFGQGVRQRLKIDVSQQQFDALISFAYNIGLRAFGNSTLLRKVNDNPNDKGIAFEFSRWVRAKGKVLPGLIRRRKEESELYFS